MEEKRHYSYFVVKPDGIKFLDKICEDIEEKYESVRYYAISNFENIIKKLYHKHYEEKGEKFAESFESYLYGLKELFGNEAVLILVGDSKKTYQEVMQQTFDTKIELREKYVNDNVAFITNYGNREEYIRLVSSDGKQQKPRKMDSCGSYRISDMNVIHCPDPTKEANLDELKILMDEGIIDDKNLITYDTISKMKRYQTANFQKDMREEGYVGEIKPDISGWVKSKINEDLEER